MRVRLIACVLGLAAATDAAAQDDCRQFSWTAGRKLDLFAGYLPTVESAQSLPKEGAFALVLRPAAEVIYPVMPERGSDSGYGGVVTLEGIAAGRYQIALSQAVWLEAVQGDTRLPLLAAGAAGDCPGVQRSLQVTVESRPLMLQIGGAAAPRLNISLVRVWPPEWKW